MVDPLKVKPIGPWFLIKVKPAPTKSESGRLYLPAGNLPERLGHAVGEVIRAGTGMLTKKGRRVPYDVGLGETVLFRGHLQEANQPGGYLNREYCLIHGDDLVLKAV